MSDYFARLPSFGKELVFASILFIFCFRSLFCRIQKPSFISFFYICFLISYWLIGLSNNAPDKFAIRYYLFPIIMYYIVINLKADCITIFNKIITLYFYTLLGVGYFQIIINFEKFKEVLSQPFALALVNLKINRLYLFFDYPILAGLTLVIITLYFFLFRKNYVNTILSLPIIIATFSRTAIIGFIFSLLIFFIIVSPKIVKMISTVLIVAFIAWAYMFIANDESFLMRIDLITSYWKDITFFGHGIGFCTVSNFASKIVLFDNDYLRMLYEIGFCGLLTFLIFLFHLFWKSKSVKSLVFFMFSLLTMFTCDFHSMYPVAILYYVLLGVIHRTHYFGIKQTSPIENHLSSYE